MATTNNREQATYCTMIPTSISIRPAQQSDLNSLTELVNELGYKTSNDEMEVRFDNIRNHEEYKLLVAVVDQQVAGMISLLKHYLPERNGACLRITALITKSQFRKKGIAQRLIEAAENWATEIKAGTILLNCGNREERKEAHLFYRKNGYIIKSSGYVKEIR